MSDKDDDLEAKRREPESDEDDEDDEDDVESEPEPAPRKAAAKAVAAKATASAPSTLPKSTAGVIVVLALVAGAAGGWFGKEQTAKAAAAKADAAAPVGSVAAASGPCGTWQTQICSGAGKESAACQQAKSAAELLTPSTCQAGVQAMPATLARIKSARASCDKLVAKLCGDLEPGSKTCTMVKERTPAFPPQRCDEMMNHYDEVIGQLKQMDAQGGPRIGGGPGGPGAPGGPGMSPHAPH